MGLIEKIFGTHSENELKRVYPIVDEIEAMEPEMQALSDEAAIFETRFKESLEGLVRKKTTLKMPARSMRY